MHHAIRIKNPLTRNLKPRNLLRVTDSGLQERGFTFVETLVAISILLLAIAAPLTLGSQGLAASRIARDQVIGTYLAQEAIEYARNVRDTNALAGNDWLQGLEDCVNATCVVDVPTGAIDACVVGSRDECEPLVFHKTTGLYGLAGGGSKWVETKFTRVLSIVVNEKAPSEALITAEVFWTDGLAERRLSVEESILDWQ